MMPARSLRIELRFKNAILYNALRDRFAKTAELLKKHAGQSPLIPTAAQLIGIPHTWLRQVLNLRRSPWSKKNTTYAQRCADALDMSVAELFPIDLYSYKFPRLLAREVAPPTMIPLDSPECRRLLSEGSPLDDAIAAEKIAAIQNVLLKLSPREEKILEMRYGMYDGAEYSLRDIGRYFELSVERIRQIEAQALRKLRNPVNNKPLRALL